MVCLEWRIFLMNPQYLQSSGSPHISESGNLCTGTNLDGLRGGLNRSMQHSVRTHFALKTKAKTPR